MVEFLMFLLSIGAIWTPNAPAPQTQGPGQDGGAWNVSVNSSALPTGAAQDTTVQTLFTDVQMRADMIGIHPLQPTGWDGGMTTDVSGSTVSIASEPPRVSIPNPFIPRCNPVRRTGCVP